VPASAERPPTVTAAADWLPGSRPNLPPPVILIAEVQAPEGDSVARKTAMELCSLNPPTREATGRFVHRHARGIRTAHSETEPVRVGSIKGMQAKGRPSRFAHAEPAPVRKSDIHAIP
jgi:hypothetical protein